MNDPTITHHLHVTLRGGLLLGGSAEGGFHDTTLRRADGVPFLPASALKGAIREQLRRLETAAKEPELTKRLLGEPGPDASIDALPASDETENETETSRPDGGSTRVYLTDAELADETRRELFRRGAGYASRTQVSIDRRSRRSADGHLFVREIVAPFSDGLRFRAAVDLSLLDEDDRRRFDAAVRAVFALGAGRSTGLGGVEMRLEPLEEATTRPRAERAPEIPRSGAVDLVFEALDPLCLAHHPRGNFLRTRGHLAASTLRGALVTAALRQRGLRHDPFPEPWFQELVVDPETCLRFGDAWPIDASVASDEPPEPRPAPATLWTCKAHGESHGVLDTLVRDAVHAAATDAGLFAAPDAACGTCGGRLVPCRGALESPDPERRVVTRLGLDARSARGADGQLFSMEVLERGTRLAARVTGLDAEGRRLLVDAAATTLRVGHGRGQGYGRLRLVDARPVPASDLEARLDRFDARVRQAFDALAASLGRPPFAGHWLSLGLASDLVPTSASSDRALPAEAALLADLDLAGAEIVAGRLQAGQRGGWDARAGRPKPFRPLLLAGSAVLLRVADLDALRPRLRHLEARGAGDAREEGYGWIRVSDPIHEPGWRTP